MTRINATITFTDDDGKTRTESRDIETSYTSDLAGEHRAAHICLTELQVTVGEQGAPKHNAIAREWVEFPSKPGNFTEYFDIRNSQAIWYELTHLVMSAEGDLVLAQAYKALEPAQEPPFSDNDAINDLYFLHDRKMMLLNQSVHDLIKIQDVVNRLLHESLGGDLVNATDADWEKTELTRKNVITGLKAKLGMGLILQSEFDSIGNALEIPKKTPKGAIAKTYRNRLTHHIRPSVDYSMFFSPFESRVWEEVKDAQGKVMMRRHTLYSRPPVEHRFEDLHAAFSEYLDAVVAMLQQLSELDILRR